MFRYFSSLSLSLCRKIKLDQYYKLNICFYSAYSSEDKSYILDTINGRKLSSNIVGGNHLSKIINHLEKNKFNSLEDLLLVNGIGPKLLRKICDKILADRDGNLDTVPIRKKRDTHLVSPPMDMKNNSFQSVIAIHIGAENITWALINTLQKDLLEWGFTESFVESGSLFYFIEMVQKVNPLIPFGDLYIMEDCGFGRQRQDVYKSQFTAMLLTSLQFLRGKNDGNTVVALAKPSLKNKSYNGFVGSERVSLQNHVVEIMEERSKTDFVIIPKELKERYFRLKPTSREDMAQALLLATSFINVILNKRTFTTN